jgi:hypothetical protein
VISLSTGIKAHRKHGLSRKHGKQVRLEDVHCENAVQAIVGYGIEKS